MATLVGRAGLVLKGAWDSDAAYDIMDVVTYDNSVYIAKQLVPAGTLPTNTTYWMVAIDASLLQTKAAGANKVSSATNGNFAALDANGDLADSGHKHSDYATKVPSATNGNLAGLDVGGNLTDSGIIAGNTSIAAIGDGSATGAISALNARCKMSGIAKSIEAWGGTGANISIKTPTKIYIISVSASGVLSGNVIDNPET